MTYLRFMGSGIDYSPCNYGASKLTFRGPQRDLDDDYVAFLGSAATFGKDVRTPFPDLVGQSLGCTAVNLGFVNAGVDTFGLDMTVRSIIQGARAIVLEVLGAHFLSNPYYAVHPRRNDRVITPTTKLRRLYPEVDFADIHFAGHLTATLMATDAQRFDEVRSQLRKTWTSRMTDLIGAAGGPVILLWAAARPMSASAGSTDGSGPLFVTDAMVKGLGSAGVVEVRTEPRWADHSDPIASAEAGRAEMHRRIAAPLSAELDPLLA